jgi:hypothetical protein
MAAGQEGLDNSLQGGERQWSLEIHWFGSHDNLKCLSIIGTHLHDTNAKHFAKHNRPHPASETVFVNFVSTFLRIIRGKKGDTKFKKELGRQANRTSNSGLLRAIATTTKCDKDGRSDTQNLGRSFRKGNNFHKRGGYFNSKAQDRCTG